MPEKTSARIWLSWSGGKDSALALDVLAEQGIPLAGLLVTLTIPHGRITMHGVRKWWIDAQAQALHLPVQYVWIPENCSNQQYEATFRQTVLHLYHKGWLTHLAFGDIFLEDIRKFREQLFASTPVSLLFPLWQKNTKDLAFRFLARKYSAWIVALHTGKIPPAWLGKPYDETFLQFLADNQKNVDFCGENGEFHTFVWNGPYFQHPVRVKPDPQIRHEIPAWDSPRDKIIYVELCHS